MSDIQRLLDYYVRAVQFPGTSGFEVLELLDGRSTLADRERELDAEQRSRVEEADSVFLRNAATFYESLSALGNLSDLRRRAAAPCSHWWWYLEKLVRSEARVDCEDTRARG
jgi:hypothetical protein